MNEHILTKEQQTELLNALNQASNNEVWSKSTILRVIGKQVCAIRDDFEKLINPKVALVNPTIQASSATDERMKVYVSIYCSKGTDMKNWERVLATLPTQLISRPMYTDEAFVVSLIRSKANKENEAYLCLDIPANALVPQERPLNDKLGNPLITLKSRSLPAEYEAVFFHDSGKYQYTNGRLIKVT